MTAHQDVAGVVERLRKHVQDRGGFAKDDNGVPVGTAWPMMLEAADLIESLSKALSEAEAEIARLKEVDSTFNELASYSNTLAARAEAAESRLAGAMKLLKRYRDETPLGNQPHMIAHEADALINAGKE